MFASNACAVQMLDVAFSRRMCCSRVCIAIRRACLPWLSMETPITRPGMVRLNASLVAKNAACGPPKPIGTPKRCELPITTSAPNSPGDCNITNAIKSVATHTKAFCACACWIKAAMSTISPVAFGYCSITPNTSWLGSSAASATINSNPKNSARVFNTSMVCGKTSLLTKNLFDFSLLERLHSVMASAAAVASSSKEALAMSIPVKSVIIC